ncbi:MULTISPECIES: aromatic amino acid ammonia-lyase [Rhizobium/Agrobacterium group]|uniref:Aromatic amino acid lyase n=1 Tax=Neorhizobium petrolearium TaxID=515361 RepID=A0ABY8M1Y8_9HYPH|nr:MULTISPECIES: aromatic amino acid ammonia-lyase [Rhizobium/Agrobacterium group]KGD86505.1 histidine ammonia-lyase [Rhizobium sp. YS-1r]MCC2613440.1 aromatic amino acid lyase [Neorhizobium petrolearium]WGI68517.1 aromatic amino acid lyase [Neorhizobium petrolearium]
MPDPKPLIELTGQPIGFTELLLIGENKVRLTAAPEGLARVQAARAVVEQAMAEGKPVYGATTGVGAMKDVAWSSEELDAFNLGLVRAHHFGTGEPFPISVVRNAMALRVNTALTGYVGCSTDLVNNYLELLSADVIPVVRRTGSIGCADIGLMGQIGAVLTGVGEAVYEGKRLPAAEAFKRAGLRPRRMAPRDGLASLSVNAVSFAAAAETTRAAAGALRTLLAVGLAASGAMGASRDPWIAVTHVGTPREAMIGKWLCNASEGWDWPSGTHVQDPLSLRMIAQVFGAVFESVLTAGHKILAATGRTDDNPVIAEGRVLTSGGSLPLDVTLLLESAILCMAHAARNSFNRCVLLGNGQRRDLPVNLVPEGAIATGFGPIIKLAGEIFSRVLSMTNPVSAQSLVVAGGMEDEAAFLPLVIERFDRQMQALKRLAALEALLAAQAMDIHGDKPSGAVKLVYDVVRRHAAFYTVDRPLSTEVEAIEDELASEEFLTGLIAISPIHAIDGFFALGGFGMDSFQPRPTAIDLKYP